MKKLAIIILGFVVAVAVIAESLTPFQYWGINSIGGPLTNQFTIEPWPQTNVIVGLGTNVLAGTARIYTPDANGYVFGYLAANNYRLTITGFVRGVTFGMPQTPSTTQNIASLAGFPVVTFNNFTVAQISDAGTAAYSNATAFALRTYLGITNALNFAPATNTSAGLIATLLYTPATNNFAAAADYGRITNNGRVWMTTNLADGVAPTALLPNGSLITSSNGALWVRSNANWYQK